MNISKTRIGAAAGLLAGSAGLVLASGFGPGPGLVPIASAHGGSDDATTSSTIDDSPSTTLGSPAESGTRVVNAAGAGTVTVASLNGRLELVDASPVAGWTVEVEQASGTEVEVDFRRGEQRVQVNVEIEDGAIRERVRIRDDAAGIDVRIENGVVVRAEGLDDDPAGDDNSGPGRADDPAGDDNSGPSVADDPAGDDNSGPGSADDPAGDDNGGHGAEVGDDNGGHGGDDPAGDDNGGHGADDPAGDDSGSGGHGADD